MSTARPQKEVTPRHSDEAHARVALGENLKWGIGVGMFFAAGFSMIAALPVVLSALFVRDGYRLAVAIPFYFGAGLLGGAILGLLRPSLDRYWGRVVTAYLILFLVYGGGTVTVLPLIRDMSAGPSVATMVVVWSVLCLILAPIYELVLRDKPRRKKRKHK